MIIQSTDWTSSSPSELMPKCSPRYRETVSIEKYPLTLKWEEEFIQLPFGIIWVPANVVWGENAPASLQMATDTILPRFKWLYGLVYLKDVKLYSKNLREHFNNFKIVLTLFWRPELH